MTAHTIDEYDAMRVHDSVAADARERDTDCPWYFEYEIPAMTNGWIYYGDMGALATAHNWADQWPNPSSAVCVRLQSTHPRDETTTDALVEYVPDMENKIEKEEIARMEGEPYRTPLPKRRLLFWQAVDRAIAWMEQNPPE